MNARWGYSGQGGAVMPSTGKIIARPFDDKEKAALSPFAPPKDALAAGEDDLSRSERRQSETESLLGPDTCDIYLNDNAYWKNVPRRVWEYTLGGYQVLKKWLSYREEPLLGRSLTLDEVDYVAQVARRIAALILLGPELDANYAAVKGETYEWHGAISNTGS